MTAHQIRQARFRVRTTKVPSQSERADWQALFETHYLRLFERALDAWLERHPELGTRTLHMPCLRLDLGTLRQAGDDEALLHSLQRQLDEQLEGGAARSEAGWALHCHLHFLRLGSWPSGSPLDSALAAEAWWRRHEPLLPRLHAQLARCLDHEPVWLRLCSQHSPGFLHWLRQEATDVSHRDSAVLATWRLWTRLREAHTALPGAGQLAALRERLAESRRLTPAEIGNSDLLRAALQEAKPSRDQSFNKRGQEANEPALAAEDADIAAALAEEEARAESAGLLVRQAGLVLLHPWLPALFRQLGLLRDEQFPDISSRLTAIFALHFAATGREEADEGELALHKHLLHWPAGQPLPVTAPLTLAQRDEIEALLQALIRHWQVLKNTSIGGLREAFLQREGTLRRDGDAWQLNVATHSIDLLLDHLPWSISLVRLPWLPAPLHVVWART